MPASPASRYGQQRYSQSGSQTSPHIALGIFANKNMAIITVPAELVAEPHVAPGAAPITGVPACWWLEGTGRHLHIHHTAQLYCVVNNHRLIHANLEKGAGRTRSHNQGDDRRRVPVRRGVYSSNSCLRSSCRLAQKRRGKPKGLPLGNDTNWCQNELGFVRNCAQSTPCLMAA